MSQQSGAKCFSEKKFVLEKFLSMNTKPQQNVLPIQQILYASLYAYLEF